jgi:WXG100 family type VII secretion target
MGRIVKLNYDFLRSQSSKWRSEQQDIDNLLKQTKSQVEGLHNNQWVGDAADKFFNEMEQKVFPSLGKLVHALGQGADATKKIEDTIRQHDEETKGFFGGLI